MYPYPLSAKWTTLLLGSVLLIICLTIFILTHEPYRKLHLLENEEIPLFIDDADIASLISVTRKQIEYLEKQNLLDSKSFGDRSYSSAWLLDSAKDFLTLLETSPSQSDFNQNIREKFDIYQAGGRKKSGQRRMLVTGYYEPVFKGNLEKVPPYLTPIYYPPSSLTTTISNDNQKLVGRIDENNQFKPFWSRSEIENDNLLKGYELAYLKDPFDAYLLHVQGSGKIELPDKSLLAVRFAGSNGLEYNSIGKLLVDEKHMELENVSIPTIRHFLQKHPEQQQRILHHNPRFIFFKRGDNLGPRGSSDVRLTPGRSIAIDWDSLPGGTIGFLTSRRPELDKNGKIDQWTQLNRFVFPQDSGSAIKGTGRVDLFWGNGEYAEVAASHMKEEGKLYFLVKKKPPTK